MPDHSRSLVPVCLHRRSCRMALLVLVAALLPGLAQACTATITWPIVEDRQKPGYREEIHMLVDGGTNVSYSGCPVGGDLQMKVNIHGPGLRWVMDLFLSGRWMARCRCTKPGRIPH